MLNPKDLQTWAKGASADAMSPAEETNPDSNPDEGEDELGAERNAVWAGEEEVTEETEEEDLDEFLSWLEENEPELADAFMELADAVASEDERMIEHAKQELKAATQYLNPEYPPLPESKREEAGEAIAKHMRDKGHPKKGTMPWKQAVAIGLSEARRGEAP